MSAPVFRNPEMFEVLGFREFIRNHMPNGSSGYVVEDLDLLTRVYGRNYQVDDTGRFRLIELKFGTANLNLSKEKTFGLIDSLLRQADPYEDRYDGFYLVNYTDRDWEVADFSVNGWDVERSEFLSWMNYDDPRFASYEFKR